MTMTKKTKTPKDIFTPGEQVFVRTVTNYYTGRVNTKTPLYVELDDAAWIACTKRFADSMKTGEFDEVEPYPSGVCVFLGAIVDVCRFPHKLPRDQK